MCLMFTVGHHRLSGYVRSLQISISNLLSCHTLIRAAPIHIKHVYDFKIWMIASVHSEPGHKNQRERRPRAAGGDATRR